MRWIILVLLCFSVSASSAGSLYLGQISHHFNKDTDIKREHHSLVIYEHTNSGVLVGYWRNSYDRHTIAVGKNWLRYQLPIGQVGLKAGLATGYHIPIFGTLYYDVGPVSINYVPSEVIGIGLKYNF